MNSLQVSWKERLKLFIQNNRSPLLIGGLLICCLIIGRLLIDRFSSKDEKGSPPKGPSLEVIQQSVSDVLVAHEVRWQNISNRSQPTAQWQIPVPADLPESDLRVSIQQGLSAIGAEVIRSHSDPVTHCLIWDIGWVDSCLISLRFTKVNYKRCAGKIAILIDDFGDRYDAFVRSFFELEGDISISVIPGLPKSKQIVSEAVARGCDVVMHLPMEPIDGPYPDQGFTIITEMSQEQVEDIFQRAFKLMPEVKGINNHMGSKITADRRIMGYLMTAIKSENLYFLDSRTITSSVAYEVAASNGLRCAERDVFLDTDPEIESIHLKMAELAYEAEKKGVAIGIGHCYRSTMEVLREDIPKFKEKGFRFVRLSEVVK